MTPVITNTTFTLDEYIQYEWKAEERHEFINGQLFTMPSEKDINNKQKLLIPFMLMQFLKEKGYDITLTM
jgi:Uma2 family endonuclease